MPRLEYIEGKILDIDHAIIRCKMWQNTGQKIVFTNGCFDILHKGHVTYLSKSADLGTKLIVAINTDLSVKRLGKAINRPINKEMDRAFVLSALGFIDMIVLFNEDTPLEVIKKLNPNILVKGADYDAEESNSKSKTYIVGSDFVKSQGGHVYTIALEQGFSTTAIINKIKN